MTVNLNPSASRPLPATISATAPAIKAEPAALLGTNGEPIDSFQQAPMEPVMKGHVTQPELTLAGRETKAPPTAPGKTPTVAPGKTPTVAPGKTPTVAPALSLAAPTAPESLTVRPMRKIEAMAGGLVLGKGAVQQLNNNHPEIITSLKDGNIAISTLSGTPTGLNHSFNGVFRLFSSNQNRTGATLMQTVALRNPSDRPVTVTVSAWATTNTSEAPYQDPSKRADGTAFENLETLQRGSTVTPNGPGQYNAARILLGDNELPPQSRKVTIPPGGTVTLPSASLPNGNELITQGNLHSNGPVQVGIVYNTNTPTAAQVEKQLQTGSRLGTSHHDKVPTPLGAPGAIIFGRVAGVTETSTYRGVMSNSQDHSRYLVTGAGEQSFAFNTKRGVDLGTGRNEAARMIARNDNAAYESPLNYGAELNLGGAFHNPTNQPQRVQLFLDSPVSSNDSRVMRGSFEVKLRTSEGAPPQTQTVTVSQAQQTRGKTPLLEFTLQPGASAQVDLRTVYGANNTGPQAIRVVTSKAE